jgi:hypothetical protein
MDGLATKLDFPIFGEKLDILKMKNNQLGLVLLLHAVLSIAGILHLFQIVKFTATC